MRHELGLGILILHVPCYNKKSTTKPFKWFIKILIYPSYQYVHNFFFFSSTNELKPLCNMNMWDKDSIPFLQTHLQVSRTQKNKEKLDCFLLELS